MVYLITQEITNMLKKEKPYSQLDALFDILSMADENGQLYSTTRKLMERWGWGSSKTVSFLKKLEDQNIIRTQTEHKQNTKISINEGFFGDIQNTNRTQIEHKQNIKIKEKPLENVEIYRRIIDYMNNKCGTRYRYENEDAMKFIHERLDEGFSEEDFYTVIDKKVNEWIGTKWEQYLRPYTLFRKDRFEDYLNQKAKRSKIIGNTYLDAIKNRVSIVDTWMEDD